MGMSKMPEVISLNGGKAWEHDFEKFNVVVYVPKDELISDVVNFGFKSPYLVVLPEKKLSKEQAADFAERNGLADIARRTATSVAFVYPSAGDWKDADKELYVELIKETKIHQYYKDGVVTFKDRFTKEWGECFIRGAKYRTCLYGFGASADYVANNLLTTIEGEFLWGPGDITPTVCVLENLSVMPKPSRRDIPIVSVANSAKVNEALKSTCDKLLIKDKADYIEDYDKFVGKYKRWCGNLEPVPDFDALGMVEVAGYEELTTSSDNAGDDMGTATHKVGYLAYYNKGLLDNGPVPTLLAFHGGGDSSSYITEVSGWYEVARKYNFLLIAIENHINSTATEMIELISRLKDKFNIDEHRIYGSGFSMGGCKSWDLYQEYPNVFAALAPMDATFELGLNVYGQPMKGELNKTVPVPVFYAGGEITPLPELPFQAQKCHDRIKYLFEVNKVKTPYDVKFEDKDNWKNPIWGIDGDRVVKEHDASRDSILTMHYFDSEDGVCRTCLASISEQGHECRQHTCDFAWQFMSKFTR